MNLLPLEIQVKIGEYLTLHEFYSTQYILQTNAIQYLKFPLIFPIRPFDNINFCKWLLRWKDYLHNIKSIHINYLQKQYKAATFEILSLINLKKMDNLHFYNILCLFDYLSPRTLFAFRSFFLKLDIVKNIYLDARLIQFCSHLKHTKFTTYSTIGTRVIFYKNDSDKDSRETSLIWLNNFNHHVNIKCWCYSSHGICKTLQRVPTEKLNQVTILHRS